MTEQRWNALMSAVQALTIAVGGALTAFGWDNSSLTSGGIGAALAVVPALINVFKQLQT
jgi:hypothetical protein